MAVYMFTLHAYRSWMPDHRRGFVIRGRGIQKPDPDRAAWYQRQARHERMIFTDDLCDQIIAALQEVSRRQDWRLLAVVVVWTHIHLVISWPGFREARRVRALNKRAITTWLRDFTSQRRKWLAGGGSIRRVRDQAHYLRLTRHYLPAHRRYGGRQWYAWQQHEQSG